MNNLKEVWAAMAVVGILYGVIAGALWTWSGSLTIAIFITSVLLLTAWFPLVGSIFDGYEQTFGFTTGLFSFTLFFALFAIDSPVQVLKISALLVALFFGAVYLRCVSRMMDYLPDEPILVQLSALVPGWNVVVCGAVLLYRHLMFRRRLTIRI